MRSLFNMFHDLFGGHNGHVQPNDRDRKSAQRDEEITEAERRVRRLDGVLSSDEDLFNQRRDK